MPRPPRWHSTLEAAADEACLAVRLYNDPAESRSLEGFVVHMHLAWLYLLHAELSRDGVDYRYRDRERPRRLLRVNGEPKRWGLSECVSERMAPADPVRINLEFFIALRNKIEHRYSKHQEALALSLAGRSQALLINFQSRITEQFGDKWSLAFRLRFPVFVGTFNDAGVESLLRSRSRIPRDVQAFIAGYDASIDDAVVEDQRFNFRLRVVLELAGSDPDSLAIQFTKLEDLTPDQKRTLTTLGRTGRVIVRERQRPVANLDHLKPREACNQVAAEIPFRFNQSHFTQTWRNLDVRPPRGARNPEATKSDWCVYDEAHQDYLYSKAYVKYLKKQLATAEGFKEIVGRAPIPK